MTINKIKIFCTTLVLLLLILQVSAATLTSVDQSRVLPGGETSLSLTIENTHNDDIEDVFLVLETEGTPFTPIGSSQASTDKIRDGRDERFTFRLKTTNSASPGNYEIPYTLTYDLGNRSLERSGSIGLVIYGSPELEYTASAETPVVGRQTAVTIRIINKGFADAKFLTVRINPQGFTLLSEDNVYIGTVDSDDFETTTFDVHLTSQIATIGGVVEYKNFENRNIVENINIPLKVYTADEAIELGIIKASNTGLYLGIIILVIIAWIIWRGIKRGRKKKRLKEKSGA